MAALNIKERYEEMKNNDLIEYLTRFPLNSEVSILVVKDKADKLQIYRGDLSAVTDAGSPFFVFEIAEEQEVNKEKLEK